MNAPLSKAHLQMLQEMHDSLSDWSGDMLRLDGTEWALLEYQWMSRAPCTLTAGQREAVAEILESGLADIAACRPMQVRPRTTLAGLAA